MGCVEIRLLNGLHARRLTSRSTIGFCQGQSAKFTPTIKFSRAESQRRKNCGAGRKIQSREATLIRYLVLRLPALDGPLDTAEDTHFISSATSAVVSAAPRHLVGFASLSFAHASGKSHSVEDSHKPAGNTVKETGCRCWRQSAVMVDLR